MDFNYLQFIVSCYVMCHMLLKCENECKFFFKCFENFIRVILEILMDSNLKISEKICFKKNFINFLFKAFLEVHLKHSSLYFFVFQIFKFCEYLQMLWIYEIILGRHLLGNLIMKLIFKGFFGTCQIEFFRYTM